jgi:hypothetical protein
VAVSMAFFVQLLDLMVEVIVFRRFRHPDLG